MGFYLYQVCYQTKAWANLVRNPQNRLKMAEPFIKDLKGKIICGYMAFGDYDAIAILEMPDNQSATSLSMALIASGVFTKIKTTPLMTWKKGVEAMKKAKQVAYQPPLPESEYIDRED